MFFIYIYLLGISHYWEVIQYQLSFCALSTRHTLVRKYYHLKQVPFWRGFGVQ